MCPQNVNNFIHNFSVKRCVCVCVAHSTIFVGPTTKKIADWYENNKWPQKRNFFKLKKEGDTRLTLIQNDENVSISAHEIIEH